MLYVICMKFLWLNNIIHDYLLLDISNFIYMCRVYLQEFWSIKYIPQCALNVGISNIEFKILWDQIISKLLQIGSQKKKQQQKRNYFSQSAETQSAKCLLFLSYAFYGYQYYIQYHFVEKVGQNLYSLLRRSLIPFPVSHTIFIIISKKFFFPLIFIHQTPRNLTHRTSNIHAQRHHKTIRKSPNFSSWTRSRPN